MSSFIFNNVSSDELGLIVTEPVVRPSWAFENAEIKRPGSASNLIVHGENYGNANMVIQTAVPEADTQTVRNIYAHLRGLGRLQISTAPQEYLMAVPEMLIPEAVAIAMCRLPLSFTLLPFARAVSPTVITLDYAGIFTQIDNSGTVYSEPEIRFRAAGEAVEITTNDDVFRMEFNSESLGKEIIIDCEAQVAYYVSGNDRITLTQYTFGSFPLLHTGANFVRFTGVSEITLNLRERWF